MLPLETVGRKKGLSKQKKATVVERSAAAGSSKGKKMPNKRTLREKTKSLHRNEVCCSESVRACVLWKTHRCTKVQCKLQRHTVLTLWKVHYDMA